jgi:hypothetical protein
VVHGVVSLEIRAEIKGRNRREIEEFFVHNAKLKLHGKTIQDWLEQVAPLTTDHEMDKKTAHVINKIQKVGHIIGSVISRHRFAVTQCGRFGLTNVNSDKADVIFYFYGLRSLAVCRRVEGTRWRYIGEAYVEGLMSDACVGRYAAQARRIELI